MAKRWSYRVMLDADGDLYWVTETSGKVERYGHDPKNTVGQRAAVRLIRTLPLVGQL